MNSTTDSCTDHHHSLRVRVRARGESEPMNKPCPLTAEGGGMVGVPPRLHQGVGFGVDQGLFSFEGKTRVWGMEVGLGLRVREVTSPSDSCSDHHPSLHIITGRFSN